MPLAVRGTDPGVGISFQLLGILEYAYGLNRGPFSTLNQSPIFDMVYGASTSMLIIRRFLLSLIIIKYQLVIKNSLMAIL